MTAKKEKATGKYVYDKKTKKVVKISEDIPSVSANNDTGCPSGGCCGGSCPHGHH
ncbi:MAG: hypothetical protein WCS77_01300 [Elusimicrobiaceae bacterium]|jgi:hypothetical protein